MNTNLHSGGDAQPRGQDVEGRCRDGAASSVKVARCAAGLAGRLYLTAEDLRATTGYVQPAAQIRWLRKHGIRHLVGADGRPRVREKWLDGSPASEQGERQEPNWGALASLGD